jgi:hypothetical protein
MNMNTSKNNDNKTNEVTVFVATPCYGGSATTQYICGLIEFIGEAREREISVDVYFNSFDSLIPRSRNTLVAQFLANPKYTHLMWIDSDIGFKGGDVVRLIDHNLPMAAGLYPLKTDNWPEDGLKEAMPMGTTKATFQERYAAFPAHVSKNKIKLSDSGLLEVVNAPTGFMLIKREVFSKLMNAFPNLKYRPNHVARSDLMENETILNNHYAFFDTMLDPDTGQYLSEDYMFCKLIARIGISSVIDTNINLKHVGAYVYEGAVRRIVEKMIAE